MDRKEFIRTCSLVCLSGTVLSTFLEGCAGANYFAQSITSNNQIVFKKREFIDTKKDKQALRKYVLLRTEKYGFPICVYRINEETYSAVLMECSHKDCELQPNGDFLICPCHGSEFSNKGVVQNPPAEENLKTFKITTDHENIYVRV